MVDLLVRPEVYSARAACRPRPEAWREPQELIDHAFAAMMATVSHTFYADIAEFQNYIDLSYPYPIVAIRLDNGNRIDYHAGVNWKRALANPKIQVIIAYVVYLPGQRSSIMGRVRKFFGGKPPKLVLMVDMESGQGFAGPGNHSSEANGLASDFANFLGTTKRVIGYANGGDWSNNWPSRPAWLKRITANYSTHNPGTWGWQYYGGLNYATEPGFPRSCPPFGGWVDMNVIGETISQILIDCGLVTPAPLPVVGEDYSMYSMVSVDKADCARRKIAWPGVFVVGGPIPIHVPHNEDVYAFLATGMKADWTKPITVDMFNNLVAAGRAVTVH